MSEPLPAGLPVLVRKLRRKRHWHSSAPTLEANEAVFFAQAAPASIQGKAAPASIQGKGNMVQLGFCAYPIQAVRSAIIREEVGQEFGHFYFKPDEAGISLTQSTGATPCHLGNRLHFDMGASEQQLHALVRRAVLAQRDVTVRSKKDMKKVVDRASKDHCLAVGQGTLECQASHCAKPAM